MGILTPTGRINRLFGTDGGVMLSLYTAFPVDFDRDTPLLVSIDGLDVPLYCERFERRGTSGAVATFADFDTERRALELLGKELRMELEEVQSEEFFMEDLIGFAVTGFESGSGEEDAGNRGPRQFAGRLTDYYDSDANPLFELEVEGKSILVPAVEEFIAHINFKRRTMKMVLPGGLLDLK